MDDTKNRILSLLDDANDDLESNDLLLLLQSIGEEIDDRIFDLQDKMKNI